MTRKARGRKPVEQGGARRSERNRQFVSVPIKQTDDISNDSAQTSDRLPVAPAEIGERRRKPSKELHLSKSRITPATANDAETQPACCPKQSPTQLGKSRSLTALSSPTADVFAKKQSVPPPEVKRKRGRPRKELSRDAKSSLPAIAEEKLEVQYKRTRGLGPSQARNAHTLNDKSDRSARQLNSIAVVPKPRRSGRSRKAVTYQEEGATSEASEHEKAENHVNQAGECQTVSNDRSSQTVKDEQDEINRTIPTRAEERDIQTGSGGGGGSRSSGSELQSLSPSETGSLSLHGHVQPVANSKASRKRHRQEQGKLVDAQAFGHKSERPTRHLNILPDDHEVRRSSRTKKQVKYQEEEEDGLEASEHAKAENHDSQAGDRKAVSNDRSSQMLKDETADINRANPIRAEERGPHTTYGGGGGSHPCGAERQPLPPAEATSLSLHECVQPVADSQAPRKRHREDKLIDAQAVGKKSARPTLQSNTVAMGHEARRSFRTRKPVKYQEDAEPSTSDCEGTAGDRYACRKERNGETLKDGNGGSQSSDSELQSVPPPKPSSLCPQGLVQQVAGSQALSSRKRLGKQQGKQNDAEEQFKREKTSATQDYGNGKCYWIDRPKHKLIDCPRLKKTLEQNPQLLKKVGDTKSCHDCQGQHPVWLCKSEHCALSYCIRCIQTRSYDLLATSQWSEDKAARFNEGFCPKCLGLCSCKACLTTVSVSTIPAFSKQQKADYAQLLLNKTLPSLDHLLRKDAKEAGYDNLSLDQVAHQSGASGERLLCDRCATSVSNLYRRCDSCNFDLCVACCEELRASGNLNCETCASTLQLWRMLDNETIAILQKAQRDYRDGLAEDTSDAKVDTDQNAVGESMVEQDRNDAEAAAAAVGIDSLPGDMLQQGCESGGPSPIDDGQDDAVADTMDTVLDKVAAADDESLAQNGTSDTIHTHASPSGLETLGKDSYRLASNRSDPAQNYVFAPMAGLLQADVKGTQQQRLMAEDARRAFHEHLDRGEPMIIREVQSCMAWDPHTMHRATREFGHKARGREKEHGVLVVNCSDWSLSDLTSHLFFKGYVDITSLGLEDEKTGEPLMLKVKDWPPSEHFSHRLVRHNQDFMEMLPMHEYTHPESAPLNMATFMPPDAVPTDLGPKCYVAYGRIKEHEGDGDSVTKLHMDMSDAFNILCHSQRTKGEPEPHKRCGDEPCCAPRYGEAGAVWDIFRRQDVPKLMRYLKEHITEFMHLGKPLEPENIRHVIYDQCFMLTSSHLAKLKEEQGVEPWHFEQHEREAVYIPAGCPHQVRNLRACLKVAQDFVAPESMAECLKMSDNLREVAKLERAVPPMDRHCCDKLQAKMMLYHSVVAAVKLLEGLAADKHMGTKQPVRRTGKR